MLQNATPLRKSAPGPPNISDNMSLVLCLPRKMHLCRSSSNVPRLPSFLEMLQNPHVFLTFNKVHNPLRLPRESTSERPKMVRSPGVFNIVTSRCASRHNGVHFFDIATSNGVFCTFWLGNVLQCSEREMLLDFSLANVLRATTACTFSTSSKSGPKLRCFIHFDLEMCFAPQRRALFRHLNFQKWSGAEVLCTFWLGNVLRATTPCNFSSLIWPAGSAPAL